MYQGKWMRVGKNWQIESSASPQHCCDASWEWDLFFAHKPTSLPCKSILTYYLHITVGNMQVICKYAGVNISVGVNISYLSISFRRNPLSLYGKIQVMRRNWGKTAFSCALKSKGICSEIPVYPVAVMLPPSTARLIRPGESETSHIKPLSN